jgi:hypothetical protein
MENKHTPTPYSVKSLDIHKSLVSVKIQANNGDTICCMLRDDSPDKANEIANAEFIVTACNNYQALKAENTLLKEVNEAQVFTIEKYQKENEELKEQIKTLNDIIDKAIEKNL